MSVPFGYTHLRVPQGFGAILEGLAREVLRNQPEDIPKYAAQYFDALLKQREDSGIEPEVAAKLEDKFYNDHAFKTTGASPEKEPAKEVAISKDKSYESQTEEESSHSAETSNLSTTQPNNVSEEADLTESTEEHEEKQDITEKHSISLEKGLSEKESINTLPADDLFVTEEKKDPAITTFDQVDMISNGKDSSSASEQNIPQSKLEPTDLLSFREISNLDVCAQELGVAGDDRGGKQENAIIDEVIGHSDGEENRDTDEPAEALPYSGLPDKDVCATELRGTEKTMVKATAEDDGSSKLQPEGVVVQSSLSQSETPESKLHEAEDQVEKTEEEEGEDTVAPSGGLHESSADTEGGLESNTLPKEDSLVEISFEDVPEIQQIKGVEEEQPEEESSIEVLQTKLLEPQHEEESKEVTEVARDQIISSTQEHDEPEMMGVEKEVHSEGGEMGSQYQASDMKEKVDTNDDDHDDDDESKGVKTISSSPQPTTKANIENPQDEPDHKNDDNEKIREGKYHQNEDSEKEAKSNEPDFKEDEISDTVGGDKEDAHTDVYSEVEDQEIDGGTEKHPSQVSQSMESESLETSVQHLEQNESQRTHVESQLEDTVDENEVTSKERTSEAVELVEEGKMDSEKLEKSDAIHEEVIISPAPSTDQPTADHQGQERPLGSEADSTEPEGKRGDEEECSRPQEEEDIMDIPLDDPEANRAAAKIQAGFRGHMTRKKMKPEDKAEGEERAEDRGQ